jgi:hypothetical protein
MTMTRAIFLSYASQDAGPAKKLCDALRAAGLEVWFDQSELRGGDAWDASIRKQIEGCALVRDNFRERSLSWMALDAQVNVFALWVAKLGGSAFSSKKASNGTPAAEFFTASKRLIRQLNTESHSANFVFPAKAGFKRSSSPNDKRRRIPASSEKTRRNSHSLVAGSSANIDQTFQWVEHVYAQAMRGLLL